MTNRLLALMTIALTAGTTLPAAAAPVPVDRGLAWHSCKLGPNDPVGAELEKAGAQCTEIRVPLDYTKPNGRQITLAVSRLKATSNRIGTLMLNAGGPGGPTLPMPLEVSGFLGDLAKRFDLVGMDPRFVGRSTPIDCKWDTGQPFRFATDKAAFNRQAKLQKSLADKCQQEHSDLLPYATTRNTARDLDRVREALGETKVSYLGYSYGTYLGAVYLQMFGHRVDRAVLDSAVDPDIYGPQLLKASGAASEAALRDWSAWAARHHSTYGLGRTTAQVIATVDRILAAGPLQVGDHRVDKESIPVLLYADLGVDSDEVNAMLADNVRTLKLAASGKPVKPSPEFDELLRAFGTEEGATQGSQAVALICGDKPAPRTPASYWRDIQLHRLDEPHFGPVFRNMLPCAYWPKPVEPATEIRNDVPALVLNATGDPRTTYASALQMHKRLSASRLVTLEGSRTHGVFGDPKAGCANAVVLKYLADGKLPTHNITCQKA